jgi:hypothetical protein
MRLGSKSALVLAALACASCGGGDERPTPLPTPPDPALGVTPTAATGPTQITFLASSPAPGSTTTGCGPSVEGCRGQLTMTFRLLSPAGGPVLRFAAFLHSRQLTACLSTTTTGSFDLQPGQPREIQVVFDRADACATPVDLVTMDATAEGVVTIASRQEWGLRYSLAP